MSLKDKNKFQLLRGGVPGNYNGCVDSVETTVAGLAVASGDFVEFTAAGYAKVATASKKPYYCVIEGNAQEDSFAGNFTNRIAVVRGNYRVQTTVFDPAGIVPGASLTIVNGKLANAVGEAVVVGMAISVGADNTLVADMF